MSTGPLVCAANAWETLPRSRKLGVEALKGVLDDGIVGAQMWLALPDATRDGPRGSSIMPSSLPSTSDRGRPVSSPGSSTALARLLGWITLPSAST